METKQKHQLMTRKDHNQQREDQYLQKITNRRQKYKIRTREYRSQLSEEQKRQKPGE